MKKIAKITSLIKYGNKRHESPHLTNQGPGGAMRLVSSIKKNAFGSLIQQSSNLRSFGLLFNNLQTYGVLVFNSTILFSCYTFSFKTTFTDKMYKGEKEKNFCLRVTILIECHRFLGQGPNF